MSARARWARGIPALAAFAILLSASPKDAAAGAATITSSDTELNASIVWAAAMATSWVQHGMPLPCYWAGGQNRAAFYARDTAHQVLGAHFLGLDAENFAMLRALAASSSEGRRWYSLWSLTFAGEPFGKDYHADDQFVRELPAPFELIQRAYEQYLWTGNLDYINDPTLVAFYGHVVNEFVALHDANGNGIAEEAGSGDLFQGVPSYNENGEHLVESGDALGAQYQALVAYSALLRAKGMAAEAATASERAAKLRKTFNSAWWSAGDQRYVRGIDRDGNPKTNYGKESSFFLLMKLVPEPGPRTDALLDEVDHDSDGINIEASTYLPDAFYPYGRVDEGWKRLKSVFASRSDYPEVSYSAIGNTVAGLMGVEADAVAAEVRTLPRLPADLAWIQGDHLAVGAHDLSIRHEGCGRTTLVHAAGPGPITWTARFYGSVSLKADGAAATGTSGNLNGRAITVLSRAVAVGSTATVEVVGADSACSSGPLQGGADAGSLSGSLDASTGGTAALGSASAGSPGVGGALGELAGASAGGDQARKHDASGSGCGCQLALAESNAFGPVWLSATVLCFLVRLRRYRSA